MKKYYRYKTFGDWAKGTYSRCLMSIGDMLHNVGVSMVDKGIDIGERLIYDYIGEERGHVPGLVKYHFRGFDHESN